MASPAHMPESKPDYVSALEKIFGAPNQNAFGSSVFFVPAVEQSASLEADGFAKYKFFVGEVWERLGEENWKNGWSLVYARDVRASPDIVTELRSLPDRLARQSAEMLLDNLEDPEMAIGVLREAFDNSLVNELRIFNIGDTNAMSGIMIGARLTGTGSLFLALLMD
jgi:hypothetical protein